MMEYTKTMNGPEMVISMEGRLDTETAPRFEQEIMPELATVSSLVLDLKDLEYTSSAGLRVLLALKKAMSAKGGDLSVRNVSESVLSIFHIAGFDMILNIQR